jgi:glucokinase
MSSQSNYALAFDFGGTKLAAGLVNITDGSISNLVRLPAPAVEGADACLQAMVKAGTTILQTCVIPRNDIKGIGISFGGIVSDDLRTVVTSMHVRNWNSFPLPDKIAELFKIPTFMENDGNAAALGEWAFGAGKGTRNMLYVQVSTGVGSGLILSGKLFRGQGLAGEFGHMTIEPDGPVCACGKKGCVESLASGWALQQCALEAFQKAETNSPLYRLGHINPGQIDARMLIQACQEGDEQASIIVHRGFRALGLGICNAAALLDPEMVVLGGGITRNWDVLSPIIYATMQEFLLPVSQQRMKLAHSILDGTETLLGAAMLTSEYADQIKY